MSRFSDYLASAITPQMTLLEKFNALLKYLEEEDLRKSEIYPAMFLQYEFPYYSSNSVMANGFEPEENYVLDIKTVPVVLGSNEWGFYVLDRKSGQLAMETFGLPDSKNEFNEILGLYFNNDTTNKCFILLKSPSGKIYLTRVNA